MFAVGTAAQTHSRRQAAVAVEFDWARLLEELLFEIAMKLECVQDLVVFSAVCSSWRAVYMKVKPVWNPAMPWLILPQKGNVVIPCTRPVFDPNANKIYHIEFPEMFFHRCWGCGDGWILTLGFDLEFHLYNPLTKMLIKIPSAKTIPFPPFKDVDIGDHDYAEKVLWIMKCGIVSVTMLKIPPDDEIVILLVCQGNMLEKWMVFAKSVYSIWMDLTGPSPDRIVQCAGSFEDKLMILYEDGTLAVLGLDFFKLPILAEYEGVQYSTKCGDDLVFDLYLVESDGDLLMVQRCADDCEDDENGELIFFEDQDPTVSYKTYCFEVYEYDFEDRYWMRGSDIRDRALFVGSNSIMCLRASKAANCKRNCIYFTEDRIKSNKRFMGHDMGIYNVRGRDIEELYQRGDVVSEFCPPFWFMPKLV